MNMIRKGLLATLVSATCVLPALAADTAITMEGKVYAAPCTVKNNGSQTVTLQDVAASVMVDAGDTGEWKPFTVELIGCPAGTTSVTATFRGTSADTTKYANAIGAGYADKVAVQVQNTGGAAEDKGDGKTMTVNVDASHNATFELQARPYSLGNATVGNIQAVMTLDFTYN